jgi:hypothetical protein
MCRLADARQHADGAKSNLASCEQVGLPTRGLGGQGKTVALATDRDTATLLILGDSIVGRALELLLRGPDLDVRLLEEPSLEEPGFLDGVRILLIAPGMSAGLREDLMTLVEDRPFAERIPILELTSDSRELKGNSGRSFLPWPCPIEDLKRWIQDALLACNSAGQDNRNTRARTKEGRDA